MGLYKFISGAGADMGVYEGETERGALDAMARDAGYESQNEVESRIGAWDGTSEDVSGLYVVTCESGHLWLVRAESAQDAVAAWSGEDAACSAARPRDSEQIDHLRAMRQCDETAS